MKRLVAVAVHTEQLAPPTSEELKWIHEENPKLTKDELHNYEKNTSKGGWGGVYYSVDSKNQIYLYIVDTFCFLDVNKQSSDEINYIAYVGTKYDLLNKKYDANYHYVTLKEDKNRKDLDLNSRSTNTIEFQGDYTLTYLPNCETVSDIWGALIEKMGEEKVKNGFAHDNGGKPLEEIPV